MKVVHVISGLGNGGAEAVLYRLITGDNANNHHVISLTDQGLYGRHLTAAGIPVSTLNMPRGRVTVSGLWQLYRLMQSSTPDVVQTWMYHGDLIGGAIARLAGIRAVVWSVRASDLVSGKTSRMTLFLRWLCAKASRVIPAKITVNSVAGRNTHAVLGFDETKMVHIPNGFNADDLRPDANARATFRRQWNVASGQAVIGMVARWDPLKDHATLIAALGRLRDTGMTTWHCILMGPGVTDENAELRALLTQHRVADHISLAGATSDIPTAMNGLDLHVLSSLVEAFPNVLAEAMACGTPCVTTDVGDAASIVGSTGWIVPHSDPVALAEAMRVALGAMQDGTAWEGRRTACRVRIMDNFSLKRMIGGFNEVWNEAGHA